MSSNYTYKNTLKAYLPLLIPTLVNFIGYGILTMVDLLVIRELNDTDAVTASSLAKKICFAPIYFLAGFTNALSVITVQCTVNHDYKRSTEALKSTIFLSVSFSLCSFIVLYFFPSIVYNMHQTQRVARITAHYVPILAIAIIPWTISMCIRRYLRGLAWAKSAMLTNILGSILNIFMSYTLVYGAYHFPNMGLYGLPIAVIISRLFNFGLSSYFLFLLYKQQLVHWPSSMQLDKAMTKRILTLGLPLGIELFGSYLYNGLVMQILTGQLGAETNKLATFLANIDNIFRTACIAVSVVATILTSKVWKERDKKAQHLVKEVGYLLAMVSSLIAMILFYYTFYPLTRLANPILAEDKKAMGKLATMLWYSLPTLYLYCLKLLSIGLLSGLGEGISACMITLSTYFLVGYPLSYMLGVYIGWGIQGVFMGNNIAYLLIILLCNHRFHRKCRKPWQRKTL